MALTEVNSLGIKDLEVKTADIAADAVNGDKIADDSINSEHYVDASIDHQHLADDCVDGDNIADNAVGLAAMAHGTDGQIITYDASGAPVAVGPGTDGQVLTSTGAGSPPAFEAIPASGSATNLMMNGAMNVAQKATSSTSGGFQVMDRWQLNDNNTNTTITQSQHALTSGDTGPWALGFRNSYSVALSSAGNSLSAASYCQLKYMIEAQDIACSGWDYTSASSYITFSFWFKCSTNQTFHARWESYDGTAQNYPFSFTATGNNTWTKITKTIPGNTNITVNNDNGAGLGLSISLYSGTDRTGTVTLNQWGAFSGSTRHPNDADTWITAGASTWEITGVQLEVGNSASDFAFKPYADELRRCQRYFIKVDTSMLARGYQNYGEQVCLWPTTMRANPTIAGSTDNNDASSGWTSPKTVGLDLGADFGTNASARYGWEEGWTASAEL